MMCIDSFRNYILCLLLLFYYIIEDFCCYYYINSFYHYMMCIDSLENYILCLLLLFYYIIQDFCCYSILTAFIIMKCIDFLECYILFVNNNSKKKKKTTNKQTKLCQWPLAYTFAGFFKECFFLPPVHLKIPLPLLAVLIAQQSSGKKKNGGVYGTRNPQRLSKQGLLRSPLAQEHSRKRFAQCQGFSSIQCCVSSCIHYTYSKRFC